MKIVKNYKGLKKWAKTLFVALLTICIIFTTTGIGTLIAYAEPDDCSEGGQHEAAAAQWLPDDNNTHSCYTKCAKCHENLIVEDSESHVFDGYEEKDADSHYKLCSKCGARIEEAHADSGDGTCVCGYVMNVAPDPAIDPDTVPAADPDTDSAPVMLRGPLGTPPILTSPSPSPIDLSSSEIYMGISYNNTTNLLDYELKYGGVTGTPLVEGTDFYLDTPIIMDDGTAPSYTAIGIGNYTGTVTVSSPIPAHSLYDYGDNPAVTVLFDGRTTKLGSYTGSVRISAQNGFKVATSPTGSFSNNIEINRVGTDQNITLYFKKDSGNVVIRKQITGLTITDDMPVKYDGSSTKNASYVGKVDITIDGYSLGLSSTGPFSSTYTHRTVGPDQIITLYLRDNLTGTVLAVPKTISGITILPADDSANGSSSGRITVDDYSSNKIAATDETVYATRDLQRIKIEAANATSGVTTIEYATSEEPYYTISDITGAVVDGKMKWKPYSDTGRPTIPANKASYIYARITDGNGGYTYLSTGKIIHDNLAPLITNAILSANTQASAQTTGSSSTTGTKNKSTEHLLVVTGKDTPAGIEKFYMVYEEKKSDSKTPTVDEVIEKGVSSTVETRDGENAGASFPLSGIASDKTYIFHIVAVDKLGNKSLIKTITSKGKGASSKEASGNSIDSGSDGSKLAPAPNGIAGSGGGSAAGGSGSGAQSGKNGLTPAPNGIAGSGSGSGSALDREINRKPYISDATGDTKIGLEATGGWDKITKEVTDAKEGTSIDVEMAGLSVVPDRVLGAMRGRNVSVRFQLPDNVEWLINGQDIQTTSGADIDMGVVIGARNIPLDMLDAVTGSYPHTEIELKHNGPLGFTGKLRVPLGDNSNGMYAYLYYYDTQANEMVLKQSAQVTSSGIAEFTFDHASDYTIVVRAEEMLAAAPADEAADADAERAAAALAEAASVSGSDVAYTTFTMNDAIGSRASVRIWLFAVAVISALLCGAILFMPGLQSPETARQEY